MDSGWRLPDYIFGSLSYMNPWSLLQGQRYARNAKFHLLALASSSTLQAGGHRTERPAYFKVEISSLPISVALS